MGANTYSPLKDVEILNALHISHAIMHRNSVTFVPSSRFQRQ